MLIRTISVNMHGLYNTVHVHVHAHVHVHVHVVITLFFGFIDNDITGSGT